MMDISMEVKREVDELETLLEDMYEFGRRHREGMKDGEYTEVHKDMNSKYQIILLKVKSAREALEGMHEWIYNNGENSNRVVWIQKMNKYRQRVEYIEYNTTKTYRYMSDVIHDRQQKEYLYSSSSSERRGTSDKSMMNVVRERDLLDDSSRLCSDSIVYGSGVLGSLDRQDSMMQRVKQRLMNIGNDIGVSHMLSRSIQTRNVQDNRMILGLGMLTVLSIVLLYVYFY